MTTPTSNYSHTQTNLTYSFGSFSASRPVERKTFAPPNIKRVVIVGGGSAGWMAAMILADGLIKKGIEIMLVESPVLGIIGVGEGSTPWLRGFFDSLQKEVLKDIPKKREEAALQIYYW